MYEKLTSLPTGLRISLPEDAQKVYLQAFNEYYSSAKGDNKESIAHIKAWSAVKQQFELTDTGWQKK